MMHLGFGVLRNVWFSSSAIFFFSLVTTICLRKTLKKSLVSVFICGCSIKQPNFRLSKTIIFYIWKFSFLGGYCAYFSNTTPNTSSTSPASPLPVIFAKQSAADRKFSAASTTSVSAAAVS